MQILASMLDEFSDSDAFEDMCTEIMQREGYTHIQPIGGPGDEGRDAETIIYESRLGDRTVYFQFTLEKNVKKKVLETLNRLKATNRRPHELICVFSHKVGPKLRDPLVDAALSDFGQAIEVRGRRFLVTRLGQAPYRDITTRYFAKALNQLKELWEEDALFSDVVELDDQTRRCLINLMLYGNHPFAGDFTEQLIRQTIVRVVSVHSIGVRVDPLLALVADRLPNTLKVTKDMIASELRQLEAGHSVSITEDMVIVDESMATQTRIEAASLSAGKAEIYATLEAALPSPRPEEPSTDELRVAANCFLASLFRRYGTEVANSILDDGADVGFGTVLGPDQVDNLIAATVPAWTPHIRQRYTDGIRRMLAHPSDAALEYLNALSRSYVLMQVVSANPASINLHRERIMSSVAVLDTDVILSAIVAGSDRQATSQSIIDRALQLGITIFAGRDVLKEIVYRIERSIHLFDDLGRPRLLPPDKADMVSDIFLDIYFDRVATGEELSFDSFIGRYYDPHCAVAHIEELLTVELGVSIQNLNGYMLVDQPQKLARLKTSIESSRKLSHTYKHEDLYESDARAMLVVEQQNREQLSKQGHGRWYLVSADRYILKAYLEHRAAFKVKPCVLPVHFLEKLRLAPHGHADEGTFEAILHSESMLRGLGRDYTPILASLSKLGVNALGMPRDQLQELIDDMDRADFTRWLCALRSPGKCRPEQLDEVSHTLQRLVGEQASRTQQLEALKARMSQSHT